MRLSVLAALGAAVLLAGGSNASALVYASANQWALANVLVFPFGGATGPSLFHVTVDNEYSWSSKTSPEGTPVSGSSRDSYDLGEIAAPPTVYFTSGGGAFLEGPGYFHGESTRRTTYNITNLSGYDLAVIYLGEWRITMSDTIAALTDPTTQYAAFSISALDAVGSQTIRCDTRLYPDGGEYLTPTPPVVIACGQRSSFMTGTIDRWVVVPDGETGHISFGFSSMFEVSEVPAPTTLALSLTTLAAAAASVLRRQRNQAIG